MKAVRLLIWVAAGALCAGMTIALGPVDQPEIVKHRAVVYFTLSFVALTIGLLVWQRRPGNRIGLLLTAFPLVDVLSNARWIFWNHAIPVTVGFALAYFYAPLFAHLILSYPTGRLATRVDRLFVGLTYLFAVLSALPFLLFLDTRAWNDRLGFACFDCALPITHVASYDISGFRDALDWIPLPLAVIFLGLLVRKLVRASPGGRRVVLPLSIVAFFAAAQFVAHIALNGTPDSSAESAWFWISTFTGIAIPLSLGLGLLLGRGARSAVADLVVELERTPPGRVREALARTLRRPVARARALAARAGVVRRQPGTNARLVALTARSGGHGARTIRCASRGARARPYAPRTPRPPRGGRRRGTARSRKRTAPGGAPGTAGRAPRFADAHRADRRRRAQASREKPPRRRATATAESRTGAAACSRTTRTRDERRGRAPFRGRRRAARCARRATRACTGHPSGDPYRPRSRRRTEIVGRALQRAGDDRGPTRAAARRVDRSCSLLPRLRVARELRKVRARICGPT